MLYITFQYSSNAAYHNIRLIQYCIITTSDSSNTAYMQYLLSPLYPKKEFLQMRINFPITTSIRG